MRSAVVWMVVGVIGLLVAGFVLGNLLPKSKEEGWVPLPPEEGVVCTLEAKICPDGSSVGRTGPNCEFAPCPGE